MSVFLRTGVFLSHGVLLAEQPFREAVAFVWWGGAAVTDENEKVSDVV